mgnify:CR=1 FL=1
MKFLENLELREDQLIYPSPRNPRLKGLSAEEPGVKALAASIRKDGQLQPIIVQKIGGRYETVDGDRRCVAIFRVLKWKTVKAAAYELTDREAMRLRLIASIIRQDLSSVEKGKFCFDLFNLIVEDDNLNPFEVWGNKAAKSKYLAELSSEVGVKPATLINWIRLWQSYSPEAQKLIASNKEELRRGLIPPSTARQAAYLARYLGVNSDVILRLTMKNAWSHKDLTEVKRLCKNGEAVTLATLPEYINQVKRTRISRVCTFDAASYHRFLEKSRMQRIRFDDYLNLAVEFALYNFVAFKQFVTEKVQGN